MGQSFSLSFSLSDTNLDKLYEGTATMYDSESITQDGRTITVTNRGTKPSGKHILYSMTAMVNWSQVGEPREFTLSATRGENDKANMRNAINLEMKKLQGAILSFSLSATNLYKLYEGTATMYESESITQDGWTITVTNRGTKPKQERKNILYSMTAMVNGSQVGEPREITLSATRGENDKANMRKAINLEMKKLQDAILSTKHIAMTLSATRGENDKANMRNAINLRINREAESKKDGLPLNLKL
jgi:hypothetical protein